MKGFLAIFALIALALLGVWLLGREDAGGRRLPGEPGSAVESVAPRPAPGAREDGDEPGDEDGDGEKADLPRVHGRVVDEQGGGIAGARVRLLTPWDSDDGEAITGPHGRFSAECRYVGLVQCFGAAEGHIPAAGPWLMVTKDQDVDAGVLVLPRGGLAIGGRVVDDDGKRVPGIELRIESEAPDEVWGRREDAFEDVSVETGEGGEFEFRNMPQGLYRLRAEVSLAGESSFVTREHVRAGTTDLRFVVPPAPRDADFELRLRVRLPDGSPLPRGHLLVRSGSASDSSPIRSGESVSSLTGHPPFDFFVLYPVSAEGEPLPFRPAIAEGLPAGRHEREVTLEPGERMGGRVFAAGVPLAGATVTLQPVVISREHLLHDPAPGIGLILDRGFPYGVDFEATTDETGRFLFSGLMDGLDRVAARIPGYRLLQPAVLARAGDREVLIEMMPVVRQLVRIEAPTGSTLGGASLLLRELIDAGMANATAQNVSLGRKSRSRSFVATLDDLKPGHSYLLQVRPGGGLGPAVIEFVAGGETVVVRLRKGQAVSGRTVRSDGTPVAGATIRSLASLPGWRPADAVDVAGFDQPRANSDLEGRFRLTGLGGGRVRISAAAPGLVLAGGPVDLQVGGDPVELTLVPAAGFSGRIEPAQPPDLRVEYWSADTAVPERVDWNLAGADGFFRHASLPPGSYRIVVRNVTHDDDDRQVVHGPLAAGAHDLRLRFAPGGRIRGRVLGAAGQPLPGIPVRLEAVGWTRGARSDLGGRFVFRALPPGRYPLRPIPAGRPGEAVVAATGEEVILRVGGD